RQLHLRQRRRRRRRLPRLPHHLRLLHPPGRHLLLVPPRRPRRLQLPPLARPLPQHRSHRRLRHHLQRLSLLLQRRRHLGLLLHLQWRRTPRRPRPRRSRTRRPRRPRRRTPPPLIPDPSALTGSITHPRTQRRSHTGCAVLLFRLTPAPPPSP